MDKKLVADRFLRAVTKTFAILPIPELLDLASAITKSQTELDTQIAEAISSLQQSASLVAKLELEVQRRADSLAKLRDEQQRLTSLSQITAAQTKALATQIESTIGRTRKWDWLKSLAINLVAGIILGTILSDWIRGLVTQLIHRI